MTPHPEKIIHKDLSYRVNGCIFDVHNEVGPGVREECYQKAMEHRLLEAGVPFVGKPKTRREFIYRSAVVDVFEPDLVVSDQLVLELKHQPEGFAPAHFTQLLSYLKFWDLRLGLLVNFAMDKAIIERLPYEPRKAAMLEDYDHLHNVIRAEHRPTLRCIRDSFLELNGQIGVGYAETTYRSLAIAEFRLRGLECNAEVEVSPEFRGGRLPKSPIKPLMIDGRICVDIQAIHDEITARAVRTMQTHLHLTGCDIGIIASFGKTKFMMRGVRA